MREPVHSHLENDENIQNLSFAKNIIIFQLAFSRLFMWASFCIKYFTTITPVNLHKKSLQSVLFSPLPSTWLINGKTEVQRVCDLTRAIYD